jgi:hypothetical protein
MDSNLVLQQFGAEARPGSVPTQELRLVLISDAIQDRNGVGTYYQDLAAHLQRYVGQVEVICPSLDVKNQIPKHLDRHARRRHPTPVLAPQTRHREDVR